MSEKKWSVKYRDHSFRGKSGKKGGSQFPRHAMNLFEGTHLGMRKKYYSKSHMGAGWHYGGAGLHSKYIVGLLNKFVGKPYEDFKQIFDNKLKQFKKYDLTWARLKDYLHDEPKTCYWKQEFYLDDNGLIQRCKLISRHNMRAKLTKKQQRFNERVKIPNLGVCRDDVHYPVKKGYWGNYEDESSVFGMNRHKKRGPILLGEFWVIVNKKVLKLPVYTYNGGYMVEYYNYQDTHYDYHLKKYVTTPFEDYVPYYVKRDESIRKKRAQVVKDWIPIKTNISSKMKGQDCWIVADNPEVIDAKRNLHNLEVQLKEQQGSENIEAWTKKIEEEKEKINTLPAKKHINLGYGKFYLFVKKADYEREVERLVSENQPH